ncbi:MAG: C39 family peptidase [Chloroflexota bacterium]
MVLLMGGVIASILLFSIPSVSSRLAWRMEAAWAYLRGILQPIGDVPTSLPVTTLSTITPTLPIASPTTTTQSVAEAVKPPPTPSPTPLPVSVSLPSPRWEEQDWNNCGPVTLALYMRTFGWRGDQFDISDVIKPERPDRNVNIEELVYYVRNYAGWLFAEYRVGGSIQLLKTFIAEGLPVMIEEGFFLEQAYWPNDDLWAGHYLLLTGYNDNTQSFTAQDSFTGPDKLIQYTDLDANWKIFNRVFILLFLPSQKATVQRILDSDWDVNLNRQRALETAREEIEVNPLDAVAWFNLGTNLVYFNRYTEAAQAYDTARSVGLPQRMLRYQFGPFIAYFHSGRTDDLLVLTEYALQITPNSEEALLWRGWGRYRKGDTNGAIADFRAALEANRFYQDARYALEYLGVTP